MLIGTFGGKYSFHNKCCFVQKRLHFGVPNVFVVNSIYIRFALCKLKKKKPFSGHHVSFSLVPRNWAMFFLPDPPPTFTHGNW